MKIGMGGNRYDYRIHIIILPLYLTIFCNRTGFRLHFERDSSDTTTEEEEPTTQQQQQLKR